VHLDPELLSRIRFAWVIEWHILLPAFTVGLASFVAFLEGAYALTRRPRSVLVCARYCGQSGTPYRGNAPLCERGFGGAPLSCSASGCSLSGRSVAVAFRCAQNIGLVERADFPDNFRWYQRFHLQRQFDDRCGQVGWFALGHCDRKH
jgi:hypothetical protein